MSTHSSSGKQTVVPCPTCSKPVTWAQGEPWRPFCSERCKLIDLGEWLSEEKRIPGEAAAVPDPNADPGSDPELY